MPRDEEADGAFWDYGYDDLGVDELCDETFDELVAEVFDVYDAEEANGA